MIPNHKTFPNKQVSPTPQSLPVLMHETYTPSAEARMEELPLRRTRQTTNTTYI